MLIGENNPLLTFLVLAFANILHKDNVPSVLFLPFFCKHISAETVDNTDDFFSNKLNNSALSITYFQKRVV